MPEFGVISGSGFYHLQGLEILQNVRVSTPFGNPSDAYRIGRLAGKEIAFLPRHGADHHIQPHRINYRANIWGFKELGVHKLISIGASGGISSEMKPGVIVLVDQLIDLTDGRKSTFFEDEEVIHIDFTEPFCPSLRNHVSASAEKCGVPMVNSGTYVCTNGPRLETAAEIKAFSLWGADLIGMTAMPEASLARESEMCFAGISVITNYAAGIVQQRLTTREVVETMSSASDKLHALLYTLFSADFSVPACECGQTLSQARMLT